MKKDTMQFIQEQLLRIKNAFQLPVPDAMYVKELKDYLHREFWTGKELYQVITFLMTDTVYSDKAKYNKYPFFEDFARLRNEINTPAERLEKRIQERENKAIGLADAVKQIGVNNV
jgi:hypothetical protein